MRLFILGFGLWMASTACYALIWAAQSNSPGEKDLGVGLVAGILLPIIWMLAIGGSVCLTIGFNRWLRGPSPP